MNQLHQLFSDFNDYRRNTTRFRKLKETRKFVSRVKLTKDREKALELMAAWCRSRNLDPRLWLYFLFAQRQWIFPPNLTVGELTDDKKVPQFHAFTDFSFFRRREQIAQRIEPAPTDFDPNRDICQTAEEAKRFYLYRNETARCMDAMTRETYGFHPRSTVCARCPASVECRGRLQGMVGFDIMALRQGQLTSGQARTQALYGAPRHGCR